MAKRKSSTPKSAVAQAATQEYRKPQADVYTVLLVVALLMLITATVALWMTMKDYEYKDSGGPNPTWHVPAIGSPLDVQHGIA
jgi:hypothetical protein